jgi:DNA polymerase III alpha subunit
MDIYEFQLRHIAYAGLARLLSIDRDAQTIMELTKISPLGKPDKVIQELSPTELKQLTKHTYTLYKQTIVSDGLALYCIPETPKYSLSDYIERLEYEMKVIKEMGFHTYMLVVSDYTTRAKNNQIMVGTGR